LASHSSGLVTPAGDAPIQHVENERADHQYPRGIKPAWVPVAHVIHGKEDSRGTAAAVRKCEEIGQMKIANHREVTRRPVWRSHCDDVTQQSILSRASWIITCSRPSRRRLAQAATVESIPLRVA